MLAMMFGLLGWLATVPLGLLIAVAVWLHRRGVVMGYRYAIAVACSPVLGIVSAVLLTVVMGDNAINPQGGGGPINTAGCLSMVFGIGGWLVTVPLGALIAVAVWLQRRPS
jgi:hypothetical protein